MTTHLLSLWNPAQNDDAMGAHLELLLEKIAEEGEDEARYVWWGKLRSQNRLQPLGHLKQILELDGACQAGAEEVHLYLTDFRSLYVAHIGEITEEDPRLVPEESGHVPAYYMMPKDPLPADCWFKLWDIRRLVAADTLAVASELRRLRNLAYHEKPVSIYGGMVNLPILVRREDEVRFFDEDTEQRYLDGKRWVQWDAERSGTGAMERELRENVLGPVVWERLDPASRTFLATAEGLVRSHREDPGFDFATALVDFAKTVEVEAGRLLRAAMKGAPDPLRIVNVDGAPKDLGHVALALGQMGRGISGDRERMDHLARRLGRWFVETLPPNLEELARIRNPASHSERVASAKVLRWRDLILGIGKHGLLEEMALCWDKLGAPR